MDSVTHGQHLALPGLDPQPQHSEGTKAPKTWSSSSAALSLSLWGPRQALSSPGDPSVVPVAEDIEPLD